MALRNGDEIEFGDRVTRGDGMLRSSTHPTAPNCADSIELDTHDSVRVTYHRLPHESSNTLAPDAPAETIGYRGGYISDDEDEEYGGSSVDDISDVSDDGYELLDEPSSSKTTPEQPKGSIGSFENPIQVEPLHPAVIDLTDDEHVSSPSQPSLRPARPTEQLVQIDLFDAMSSQGATASQPRVLDSNKVVEDSVDKNNPFYSAFQPHIPAAPPQLVTADGNKSINSAVFEDDDVSDDFQPGQSEAGVSDVSEDYAIVDDNEESEDLVNGEDEYSEKDAVDEEDAPAEDGDADSLHDPDSGELNREPSPELGSDTGFIDIPSTAPAKLNTTTKSPVMPSFPQRPLGQTAAPNFTPLQPPFDPIRSPGPPNQHAPLTFEYRDAAGNRSRSLQYSGPPVDQSAPYGLSGSGRQHIEPTFPEYHVPFASIPRTASGNIQQGPLAQNWLPGGTVSMRPQAPLQHPYWVPPPPPLHRPNGPGLGPGVHTFPPYYQPPMHAVGSLPPPAPPGTIPSTHASRPSCSELRKAPRFSYDSIFKPRTPVEPKKRVNQQNETEKDRISIDELVQGTEAAQDEESAVSPAASGVKRKANEMSSSDLLLSFDANNTVALPKQPQVIEDNAIAASTTPTDMLIAESTTEEPAPRRRRVSVEDDVSTAVAVKASSGEEDVKEAPTAAQTGTVIRSFAKYAGTAVLGGAATLAFLASPLAEKVLESML